MTDTPRVSPHRKRPVLIIIAIVALLLGGAYSLRRLTIAQSGQSGAAQPQPGDHASPPPVEPDTPDSTGPSGIPFIDNIIRPGTSSGRLPRAERSDMIIKKERVNILLLGIDRRPEEYGPSRTDTMILLSVDPKENTAAMLSIPRDLWVMIPEYGESRINVAHFAGDVRNYPGGGPALAKRTVSEILGVPVHYYVRVDFVGFEQLIDAIGGITIELESPVPPFAVGVHHMDGETALKFARTRRGSDDFHRMAHQQKVLMAALERVRSLDFPLSTTLQMVSLVNDSIQTDLNLVEMVALATIANRIDENDIRRGLIDSSMTTTVVTAQGWMVEIPHWDVILPMVEELLGEPEAWADDSPDLVRAGVTNLDRRIAIYNGTPEPGLAEAAADILGATGLNIVHTGEADHTDYAESEIIVRGEIEPPVDLLAVILGIPSEAIRQDPSMDAGVDIVVILGRQHLTQFGFH